MNLTKIELHKMINEELISNDIWHRTGNLTLKLFPATDYKKNRRNCRLRVRNYLNYIFHTGLIERRVNASILEFKWKR